MTVQIQICVIQPHSRFVIAVTHQLDIVNIVCSGSIAVKLTCISCKPIVICFCDNSVFVLIHVFLEVIIAYIRTAVIFKNIIVIVSVYNSIAVNIKFGYISVLSFFFLIMVTVDNIKIF